MHGQVYLMKNTMMDGMDKISKLEITKQDRSASHLSKQADDK
jgi:hypothetical protein